MCLSFLKYRTQINYLNIVKQTYFMINIYIMVNQNIPTPVLEFISNRGWNFFSLNKKLTLFL